MSSFAVDDLIPHMLASTNPSRSTQDGHVPLLLAPMPNGGWVIAERTCPGEMNDPVGAYSNTEAMMDGLARLVLPTVEEETDDE